MMSNPLKSRSLASMKDLTPAELKLVLDTAAAVKEGHRAVGGEVGPAEELGGHGGLLGV